MTCANRSNLWPTSKALGRDTQTVCFVGSNAPVPTVPTYSYTYTVLPIWWAALILGISEKVGTGRIVGTDGVDGGSPALAINGARNDEMVGAGSITTSAWAHRNGRQSSPHRPASDDETVHSTRAQPITVASLRPPLSARNHVAADAMAHAAMAHRPAGAPLSPTISAFRTGSRIRCTPQDFRQPACPGARGACPSWPSTRILSCSVVVWQRVFSRPGFPLPGVPSAQRDGNGARQRVLPPRNQAGPYPALGAKRGAL